ncbi:DUF3558 domain-containing protein [Streptomyces sp. NBC_00704]|uniref:DUF3558 domain-containing protein n=1 Tax=Streptomyces sp. NBC_00704 TaxID=2975809 RepID=UPI002E37D321|nr:DUF3558 domain-containing protein [Streptomyces sp. NBC_00704]
MQRKAYVPGVVALLAALVAGCTGGSDDGGSTDDANPGEAGTTSAAAQPGRYTTLPEACGVVSRSTLDSLLPGVKQLPDEPQREAAYAGEATLTYDTDRKVGCRWKVESADATDHLLLDFERVVSYDNAVSDDSQAEALFARKVTAADLPAPAVSPSGSASGAAASAAGAGASSGPSGAPSASASSSRAAAGKPSASASPSASSTVTPADLQPRLLDDLGDEAFVDDALGSSGSTAKQRTVTVAFRTSNVIVTIQYEEQPATVGVTPDSEEMQDKARKLAAQLVDSLSS